MRCVRLEDALDHDIGGHRRDAHHITALRGVHHLTAAQGDLHVLGAAAAEPREGLPCTSSQVTVMSGEYTCHAQFPLPSANGTALTGWLAAFSVPSSDFVLTQAIGRGTTVAARRR